MFKIIPLLFLIFAYFNNKVYGGVTYKEYFVQSTLMTWPDALDQCFRLEGSIASIKNEAQQQKINKLAESFSFYFPSYLFLFGSDIFGWLGASDPLRDGTWVWDDDQTIFHPPNKAPNAYKNWANPFPISSANGYACLAISYYASWK